MVQISRKKNSTFTFTVDPKGRLRCDPEVMFVKRGDPIPITWIPPKGMSIVVQCIENTPFKQTEYRKDASFSEPLRDDVLPGVYKFATAVACVAGKMRNGAGRWIPKKGIGVWMDARCPRIIID